MALIDIIRRDQEHQHRDLDKLQQHKQQTKNTSSTPWHQTPAEVFQNPWFQQYTIKNWQRIQEYDHNNPERAQLSVHWRHSHHNQDINKVPLDQNYMKKYPKGTQNCMVTFLCAHEILLQRVVCISKHMNKHHPMSKNNKRTVFSSCCWQQWKIVPSIIISWWWCPNQDFHGTCKRNWFHFSHLGILSLNIFCETIDD